MQNNQLNSLGRSGNRLQILMLIGSLVVILMILFHSSFSAPKIIFSNDCTLGMLKAQADKAWQTFTGYWQDLYWIGIPQPTRLPNITQALFSLLGPDLWGPNNGPVLFAKTYVPVALLILGVCAWIFFRQMGFKPAVCIIAALAAALNTDAFSNACWGLASWTIGHGMIFLALAAIVATSKGHSWLKLLLAGAATGIAVMEAYDTGAILSLFVGAFALFSGVIKDQRLGFGFLKGGLRLATVAIFAVLVSAQALSTLISTQIKGIVGTQQDQMTKEQRWDFATQWSLPKVETIRVLIPGLFGYRMDTPNGGAYWGTVGQQPGWEQHHQGMVRLSGSGEYAGILVVLLAVWALAQSLRRKGSPYSDGERRVVWFWSIAAILSLILAWGRFAPLYRVLYVLPFFSTIRNPIKFMQPFSIAVGILFGFGLEALARLYLARAVNQTVGLRDQLKGWWKNATGFEKKSFVGLGLWIAISIFGFLLFNNARSEITRYLESTGFNADAAATIFNFSTSEILWYLLFLLIAGGIVILIACGKFAGRNSRMAWISLGVLVAVDLCRANAPWIVYYDYTYKYTSNAVIDFLHEQPYQHRVKMIDRQLPEIFTMLQTVYSASQLQSLGMLYSNLGSLYGTEWLQHLFLYYNVQSLDIAQEPREAADNAAFRKQFPTTSAVLTAREWELTNTRYLIGLSGEFVNALNRLFDPQKNRFRVHMAFDLALKEGAPSQPQLEDLTVVPKTNGTLALIEFTGALPRAKLYSQWQVASNDTNALNLIADLNFNPEQTVVVSNGSSLPPTMNKTNAGSVQFDYYSPKHLRLKATAEQPAILLLNDKYDPNWKVWVDQQPQTMLRCNYIMRGVSLPQGQHTIDFRYEPPVTALYLSLAAIAASLVFLIWLALAMREALPANKPELTVRNA